jgi:hypothetical protein
MANLHQRETKILIRSSMTAIPTAMMQIREMEIAIHKATTT